MCTQCAIWMLTYSKLQYGSISLDKINILDGGKWTWLSLFGQWLIVFVHHLQILKCSARSVTSRVRSNFV